MKTCTKRKRIWKKLIVELTGTMETVFLRQFELIQQNFSATFAELFGGGQAELRLADKNDVLGCDIDIIAQPPGKKLQLLTLLSGGERTLTAIALLFAMLKLKPPAFCMLDEIESALDEAKRIPLCRLCEALLARHAVYPDYAPERQHGSLRHAVRRIDGGKRA